PHAGCVGRFRLTLDKEVTMVVTLDGGKTAKARIPPQTVTWETGPCGGKGEFTLITSSKPKDPGTKPMDGMRVQKKCGDFFREMRAFVFSGKAKIEIIDDIAKPVA